MAETVSLPCLKSFHGLPVPQITSRSLAFEPVESGLCLPAAPTLPTFTSLLLHVPHMLLLPASPSSLSPPSPLAGKHRVSWSYIYLSDWFIFVFMANDCKFHEGKSQVNFANSLSPGPRSVLYIRKAQRLLNTQMIKPENESPTRWVILIFVHLSVLWLCPSSAAAIPILHHKACPPFPGQGRLQSEPGTSLLFTCLRLITFAFSS